MQTFDQLIDALAWKEIPGCPGRFTLVEPRPLVTPAALAGDGAHTRGLSSPRCRDAIELVDLPGGGALLSYRRADGTYRHTLNTSQGLARKLEQLRPKDTSSP